MAHRGCFYPAVAHQLLWRPVKSAAGPPGEGMGAPMGCWGWYRTRPFQVALEGKRAGAESGPWPDRLQGHGPADQGRRLWPVTELSPHKNPAGPPQEPHLANRSWSVSGISRLGFLRAELNFSLSFSTNSLYSLAQTFQDERMRLSPFFPPRVVLLMHQGKSCHKFPEQ